MTSRTNFAAGRQIIIICLVLAIITFLVYWRVYQYGFINFDDNFYVTENSHVLSGITWDGFRWAFSTTYAQFWHPLTWLSLMFDYHFYGLNAGGYHVTNLILHILSTLLLFLLFLRMTGAVWKSTFVAALFAFHPMHVESVTWIAERKDVLSAFFWMLTLYLYVYYTEKTTARRYILVVFSYICALMSKPMVITLPVIMIILDYWPLKRFEEKKNGEIFRQLLEKAPFFILSAVFAFLTIYAQFKPRVDLPELPLVYRIFNALVSFVVYIGKTFWPHNMAIFYPFPMQIPIWQIAGALLLILVVSAAVLFKIKKLPYLFTGWMWYVVTILPVLGIITIGDFAMADRYHYLPSVGIAIMMAWGVPLIFRREDLPRRILFPLATAFLVFLALISWMQCGFWKSNIELWNHTLQVTKENDVAHYHLGLLLFAEGKTQEAIDHYDTAIGITPRFPNHYNARGIAYARLSQHQLAIEDFNQALRLKPDFALVYYSRGLSYLELGRYRKALEDFTKTIELMPDFARAYNNRGVSHEKLGRHELSLGDYDKAISLVPGYVNAYVNRGKAYLSKGDKEQGCRDMQKACELGYCRTLEAAKSSGDCL